MRMLLARSGLRAGIRLLLALCLCVAGAAHAGISFVAASTAGASAATNSITVNKPAGLVANDVMLALITQRGTNFPLDSTMISVPTGWSLVLARDNTSTVGLAIYRKVATAGEPASYTWTLGASDQTEGAIVAFRGVDTSNPVSASGSQANAAATTYTAPTITTTTGNAMLVAFFTANNGSVTVNAATGMTQSSNAGNGSAANGVSVGSSYVLQPGAGATGSKTSTGNTSLINLGALVALRPASQTVIGNWRMDEGAWNGTANEVVDSSGNGRHGTSKLANGATARASAISGTPAFSSGGQSTCNFGQFDTNTGTVRTYTYVELPTLPALASSFTVAAWIRSTNVGASGQRILVRDDADNGWGFSLGDGGSGSVRLFNRNISNSGAVSGSGVNPSCGVFCLDTNAVIANNTWYFVAAAIDTGASRITTYVFSAAGALVATTSSAYSGTWTDGSGLAAIGGETASSGEGRQTGFHFQGNVDEAQVFSGGLSQSDLQTVLNTVRTCPLTGPDHYELSLPTASLSCLPTSVTVKACADTSSPCTNAYTAVSGTTANLATAGATLAATSVAFNASGVASTTLSYPLASNGTAVSVTLSGEQTAATNARQCCANGTTCSVANSCSTTFSSAGFAIAAAANGAVTTVPTQTAGTASAGLFLRAIQTNTTTKACEAALVGANSVNWAYECNNPTVCSSSNLMSINGGAATTIQRNNNASVASYTSVPMTFDANGNAPFNFTFSDVGLATLWATKTVNSAVLLGSSNAFVTKPAGFALSAIKQTAAPQLANPGAASATDPKFIKAGEAFSLTVTAQTSGGAATPNYGKETSPEGVLLTRTLVQPAGGATGTLSNATIAGSSFISGAATVSNLAWNEVGIITLTPSVADASYLGVGDVTGTTSGNVGRFYPDHFTISAASLTPACSTGTGFTYFGQDGFTSAFTLTAQDPANVTTQNYTGSFAKLNIPTYSNYGFSAATLAAGSVLASSATAPSGSWASGVASISTKHQISRPTALAAETTITLNAAPSDGEVAAGAPVALGAGTKLRYGRLRMFNAYGSELLDLPVSVTAQYWNGTAFTLNTIDSCTQLPVPLSGSGLVFGAGNLTAGESVASINAVTSGSGTLALGDAGFKMSKPGVGNNGYVDITITAPAWLRFPWSGAGDANPSARATFGLYKSRLIYRRENF